MALAEVFPFFGPRHGARLGRLPFPRATDRASGTAKAGIEAIPATAKIVLEPIRRGDLARVGAFLHEHLDRRVSAAAWAEAANPGWVPDAPNHGFMLLDGDRVVGAHLALYSERRIAGRTERFCDLAAWCVEEPHRAHGLRLLRALLAQPDLHFTDLSPSGNVVALNERLKFRRLDTTTLLAVNLPWPTIGRDVRIVGEPSAIERALGGAELATFRAHAGSAARHLLVRRGGETCHVMFRLERRRRLKLFALLLHVGNPDLFRDAARQVFAHLLRHGAIATLVERQVVDHRGLPGLVVRSPRARMVRSDGLRPEAIDYLYSELTRIEP